ncbi:very short patch repair endonuclease [Novosphingobium decolorationis]|uniref:Very short patch repair endonuclease n=1 Tax=Novosphingobium decolorationis TaxID=2698673 RepID=A0ABX8E5V6_9SPHN|nr:very short patch repair endonuclease [Novosphingobium decolorationis]QVM84308.1 DNA mismatch endonuclease Vsr [Novosphingobium decolorationis]
MVDIVDPETRSLMMSRIRGRNTRPELALRRALHAAGYRYRLHRRDLPGSPDLVFAQYKAVIFVNGCFWHRHSDCRFATTPATRTEFWQQKFDANVARDRRNRSQLRIAGWRTGIVWECSLKESGAQKVASKLADWLKSSSDLLEV